MLVAHLQKSRYIYQSKLVKACFQHDMPYQDFKDLTRRTASAKILHEKAFNIAKIPIVIDIEGILIQPFLNLLIKKLQVKQSKMKLYLIKN